MSASVSRLAKSVAKAMGKLLKELAMKDAESIAKGKTPPLLKMTIGFSRRLAGAKDRKFRTRKNRTFRTRKNRR